MAVWDGFFKFRFCRGLCAFDEYVCFLHPHTHALFTLLRMPAADNRGSKSGLFWRLTEWGYLACLRWSLKHRWVIVLASLLVLLSTPIIYGALGKDFVPRDDQSEFELVATLPEGYTLSRGDEVMGEVERRFRRLPGVLETYTVIGETSARISKGQGMLPRVASM